MEGGGGGGGGGTLPNVIGASVLVDLSAGETGAVTVTGVPRPTVITPAAADGGTGADSVADIEHTALLVLT